MISTAATADRSQRLPPRLSLPVLTITAKGLVLAGTVLAKTSRDLHGRSQLAIDGVEERILALLATAYGKAVGPALLGKIRRAAAYWNQGETVLAAIQLALAGLPPVADEEEVSSRLALGEKLLAAGLAPRELLKACGLDPVLLDLYEAGYNPHQPRVPAGNPAGGQWTDGNVTGNGSLAPTHGEPSTAAGETPTRPTTKLHGYATVYNQNLKGRPTATGDAYDPTKMTAAVLPGTIPLKSVVTVTLDSDPRRKIDVYLNDRGLYQRIQNPDGTIANRPLPGRVIDLSSAAFKALTGTDSGKVMVTVTIKSGPRR